MFLRFCEYYVLNAFISSKPIMTEQRVCRISWFLLFLSVAVSSSRVEIVDNGPIVKGANITFTAVLYDNDNQKDSGSFLYRWVDTAIPQHKRENESKSPTDTWTVLYDDSYPQGQYVVRVTVYKWYLVYWAEQASNGVQFYINETLNGDIELVQNNQTREDIYVSNAATVIHNVSLKQTDADVVKQATTVLTYWFVDCTYYGFKKNFQFPFNYTQPDKEHFVEALVVADFSPPPPPPTTPIPTTTTTKTTTTSATTPTTKPTTSTAPPTTTKPANVTTVKPVKRKREAATEAPTPKPKIMQYVNGTLQVYNGTFPYVCNSTEVAMDPNKTYGYFYKRVRVKAPVSKVNVTGNNWLQHGDLLSLNVNCHGSRDLKYCVEYRSGVYNVTGNETCRNYEVLEKCEFSIERYFVNATAHTIVIIIENQVSKVVTPVAVTVYKVKKQAQLSVIVVPVSFSIAAVVLIVFGVAYYIQNRSRFVVEVADFNFGQNYSDMEYKTFKERLRDSIANAFFSRAPSPGSSEVPVWPPGRKYGSMTS